MKDERKIRNAMGEYRRLVAIRDDENWAHADQSVIEQQVGRPIVPRDDRNTFAGVYAAFDEAIVEAIAEALEVGVTQRTLVDNRGWLSLNDMRRHIARASRPPHYGYTPDWSQASALRAIRTDVVALAATDPEAATKLLRSAKAFLRRWVREIPASPSEQQLAAVAERWRSEHVASWRIARKQLLREVEEIGLPKDEA